MARAARGLDTDKGQSSLLSIQPFWLLFPTQPFTSQSYPCLIYVFGVLNHYAIHPLSRILEPIPFGLWCYTPISNSAIGSISPLVATPLMAPNSALVFCWASATRKCRAEASSLWAERPLPKSWGSWTMTWGWSHPKMENVQVFWCVCICTQVPKKQWNSLTDGNKWPDRTPHFLVGTRGFAWFRVFARFHLRLAGQSKWHCTCARPQINQSKGCIRNTPQSKPPTWKRNLCMHLCGQNLATATHGHRITLVISCQPVPTPIAILTRGKSLGRQWLFLLQSGPSAKRLSS